MTEHVGAPGIGGSLGECALCGKPFIKEILFGETVQSFRMQGVEQTLYGHDECLKQFEGKTCLDLPPESMIRKAYERQQEKTKDAHG